MKKKITIILIIAAIFTLLPILSSAQGFGDPGRNGGRPDGGNPPGGNPQVVDQMRCGEPPMFIVHRKWWKDSKVAEELKLSEDQIEKLDQIAYDYEKSVIRMRADIQEKRLELSVIMEEKSIDMDKAEKIVDELMEATMKLEKYEIMTRIQILSTLTDEQREKFIEITRKFARKGSRGNKVNGNKVKNRKKKKN